MTTENIRNFSIIAHIDHGKSTLADRLLEMTGTLTARQMRAQVLDGMELERERGITIKAKAIRMNYAPVAGKPGFGGGPYILNLVDTPGHVDFTYEVSRGLAACEGALLVVDASQGVEAQTLANAALARERNLKIIPVINKIDLPASDPDGTYLQIKEFLDIHEEPILCSAKDGAGVEDVLRAIIDKIPPPVGDRSAPLSALVFDSFYDPFRGVICLVRVVDGTLAAGEKIKFLASEGQYKVEDLGVMQLKLISANALGPGEIGYVVCGLKDIAKVKIGDTMTTVVNPAVALPGFRELKPYVFCGMYPVSPGDYEKLTTAISKLQLEDSSFTSIAESSEALGFGFRMGFLGLLHMDIIRERLTREFGIELVMTAPNVVYTVKMRDGKEIVVDNPAKFPQAANIGEIREPLILAKILFPSDYLGVLLQLCQDRRGEQKTLKYLSPTRVLIEYEMPFAEVVLDFYDVLKSMTKGYASFDYEFIGDQPGDLVKLDILLAGEPVDALSTIIHRNRAYYLGKKLAEKLKELIPRQQFEVPIQASIGSRVIARETLPAARKDVIAKCYGGDITRKRKLLEKQKEGKKRMKQFGRVEIPQEAFLAVLRLSD